MFQAMLLGPLMSWGSGKKLRFIPAKMVQKDLLEIKGLLEARTIVPVIDRRYPLEEAAEAFRYFGQGHARGKVVITVGYRE
jgi:NADPH:quinone reductase-like Zn-dependent oxidoreductase